MRRQGIVRSRGRALLVLLTALTLALPSVVLTPRASADDLSDARAQQRALQTKIKSQQGAIAQLKAEQGRLQTQIAATNTKLDGINADQAELRAQIQTATAALDAATRQYAGLVQQLDQLDWTLGILQGEVDQRQADLAASKQLLAARLAEAYRTQQTSLLEQVLSADSLTTVLADVGDYLSLGDQDAQLARQIQADQASLLSLQKSTDQTRFNTGQLADQVQQEAAGLARQQAQLQQAKQRLDALERQAKVFLAQQEAAFSKANATKAAATAALSREQAASASLGRRIDQIIAQNGAAWHIPSQYNGTFSWPMAGTVTQEFGCTGVPMEPPWGSCPHFHQGIDIHAAYGTPIRAAGDGVVVFVGFNPYDAPPQAWIVTIAHSASLRTMYAHMIAYDVPGGVRVGAHVSRGQIIGYEGMTGHTTGPHLHWAVYRDGIPVNPRLYL
ncbi:MAG: hypothetical protein EPN50_02270 [Chloroflexota bacterium]|nr:MAG: hypothetical protein EPN50_02270 [Chloroflexota bacterium]